MSHHPDFSVSLDQLLLRKELRVRQQGEWRQRHLLPLISFTVNMPGSVKLNSASQIVMDAGIQAIQDRSQQAGWPLVAYQLLVEKTGLEAFMVVRVSSASLLKKVMMQIEHEHPLGRLMDIDVLDVEGHIISRQGVQLPRRRCLLCERDAVICARSRQHSSAALLAKIEEMIHDYTSNV
ncbi:MAG: citrate lyase holo-[acyl-carrier protein] synthase [Vibrio sp.]